MNWHTGLLILVVACGTVGRLQAGPPTELVMEKTGLIRMDGGDFSGMCIFPDPQDNSEGTWKSPKRTSDFESVAGTSVEGTGNYDFQGGSKVELTLKAAIQGSTVDVVGTWQVQDNSKGFVRVDLFIPESLAADLVVEMDGKTAILAEWANSAAPFAKGREMVFTSQSTGVEAFRLVLSDATDGMGTAAITPFAIPNLWGHGGQERGIQFRIDPYMEGSHKAMVEDLSSIGWQIVFPESP